MELRNVGMPLVGLIVVLLLALIRMKPKSVYEGGKRVVNHDYMKENPYFQKQIKIYRAGLFVLKGLCLGCIFLCFAILSRPSEIEKISEQELKRDIFLTMDISTSVDALNEELIGTLKDTVKSLKGERFGISIFNTTSVIVVPLTDDYEYVLDSLDKIQDALRNRNDESDSAEWYMDSYISSGTLVGNEVRGSSLIGDGLASCVFYFDELDEERTRIVLFTTDNDVEGTPTVSLKEAAEICKKYGVKVYGIGTESMYEENEEEMKYAVEMTGGKYYRQESSNTVSEIVRNIEKEEKNLIDGEIEIIQTDKPLVPFLLLMVSITVLTLLERFLKIRD